MPPVLREAEVSGAQRTRLFPFHTHGTHGEGALTEPGPPQEFGRQAGAADGQSHPEALPSRPPHSCQMDPVGPHVLLCDPNSYWASTLPQSCLLCRAVWGTERLARGERKQRQKDKVPVLRELTLFSGVMTGTVAPPYHPTVFLITVFALWCVPMY